MRRYLVIVEQPGTGYSAYSPDLPGCVAAGASRGAVESEMRGAIELHLDTMRKDGESVPDATSYATCVEVAG